MPEGHWEGLGDLQEATTGRQLGAEAELEQRLAKAMSRHEHLWIVVVTHFASDQMLAAFSGESGENPILDHETIAMRPGIGCWICEEPYDKRTAHRKCRGGRG
jgi:hypothetical protein